MNDFHFDENGFLPPAQTQTVDLLFLEKQLVETFPESTTRRLIFENYRQFVADLQREVFPYFEQWVDGSFVSQKLDPNDLDVVTFLDWRVFDFRYQALERFWSHRMEQQKIDSFFAPIFPPEHPDFAANHEVTSYWQDLFGKTRKVPGEERRTKGFLKLTFAKEIQ